MLTTSDVNKILSDVESIQAEDLPYRWWAETNCETWLLRVKQEQTLDLAHKAAHEELEYAKTQGKFRRVVGAPICAMEYMLGALNVHRPDLYAHDHYELTPEGLIDYTSYGTTPRTRCYPVVMRAEHTTTASAAKVSA